tara:strand:- start:2052 stop:2660 length:609 start_codon:yes stop_codon:yes gene_type:complete
MRIFSKISIVLFGLICLCGSSSSAEELSVLEDWKWTDSKEDWQKRVPLCPKGIRNSGLGVISVNTPTTQTINSCKYQLGGINLIFDYSFFTHEQEIKLTLADYVQLKVLDKEEYEQLINILKERYPSCKGEGNEEFVLCSKYTKFSFYGYDSSSKYSGLIPSGNAGTIGLTKTDYSDKKISEIIRRRRNTRKKKLLGPLPKN